MGGLFGTGEGQSALADAAAPLVLETVTRIQELGGAPDRADRVAELRAQFEARTGAFVSEDPWFEERSRAFWCDAVTRAAFGREVERQLSEAERGWLGPLERSHRGLFLAPADSTNALVDVWSGAEFAITLLDDESLAELSAGSGQLFDARVVVSGDAGTVALLPGAVFHPREATTPIHTVLAAAREQELSTVDTLDALLRMEHALRSLSRVKPAYAYRPGALSPVTRAAQPDAEEGHGLQHAADRLRRIAKGPS